jgi:hypothetical protein
MRDPLTAPQPNDVIQAGTLQLHVHFRKPDQVYFGQFREDGQSIGAGRCDIETWKEGARLYSPSVIQRAEDVAGESEA